jgi:hypothetical protein
MTRKPALVFLLGALAVCLVGSASAQLSLIAPALPSPSDVVKLIDLLTRKDSDTSVDVKFGKTTGQGKLLIARTRVHVAMERSSRNWRGRVVVGMSVPSDISYSVDLTGIRAEDIRLDEKGHRLIVAMPTPQVEAVTPLLSEVKVDNNYRRARFKILDADTSRELQNAMLREDYQAKARREGEKQIERVREEGKEVLEAFLQRLLAGSFPGLKVVVE